MTLPIRALAPRFDPRRIAIPAQWIDASDSSTLFDAVTGGSLVAADGDVARAEDKSGNARHVKQSTANNRPKRKIAAIGGLDALLFDGGDALVTATSFSIAQPLALFLVAQPVVSTAFTSVIDGSPNRIAILQGSPSSQLLVRDANAAGTTVANQWAAGTTLQVTWIVNGSNSIVRTNAVQRATANAAAGDCTSPTMGAINEGGNFGSNVYICEFILLPIAPTAAQAEYIERGLMAKWRV